MASSPLPVLIRDFQTRRSFTPGYRPPAVGDILLEGEIFVNFADSVQCFGRGDGTFIEQPLAGGGSMFGASPSIGAVDDGPAIVAALASGTHIAQIRTRPVIGSTVTVNGFSATSQIENDVLVFGPRTVPTFTGAGKLVCNGYIVGFGASTAALGGLLPAIDNRYAELYSAALSAHSGGDGNGFIASAHQNGNAGRGQPCASIAYGLLTDPGNIVFGFFGRTDLRAPGVGTHELNSFNFYGDSPPLPGGAFPSRGYDQTAAVGIGLTIACGGTYRSTAAVHITREGGTTNTAQANFRAGIYMDTQYITDYGIFLNGDGGVQQNDGHGSAKTLIFGYMGPSSDNGLAIAAAGKVSAYGATNPFMLALSSNRNTDANVSDPANTYTVLSARVDGSINWRKGYIDGPTGNLQTQGTLSRANADGSQACGFLTNGQIFSSVSASSAGGASGLYLPVTVNGGQFKIALLNA